MTLPSGFPIAVAAGLMFGVLLWFLSPLKVAVLIVAMVVGLNLLRRPLLGLLLFAAIATFLPYSTINLGIRTTVSELLILVVWACILFQNIFEQARPRLINGSTERYVLALILFSAFPFVVGQVMVNAAGSGVANWIRWLANVSLLFLVARLVRDELTRERIVQALLIGSLAMLMLSLPIFLLERSAAAINPLLTKLGYATLDEVIRDTSGAVFLRMGSPWIHPNTLGGAMALILPLALCYGLTRSRWCRALGISVGSLGVIALLLSGSRGALLSLAVVLVWMAIRRVPFTGRLLLTGSALGLLLVLSYPPLQERISTMFEFSGDASTSVRFDEYANFPRAMAAYPLGIGFKVEPPVPGTDLLGISNLWLNFIYRLGLPGMLLFIAAIWSWWRETKPRTAKIDLTPDNAIWLGTTAGLVAALFSGLFDHYFGFQPVLVGLFWLMIGLSLQEARRLGTIENRAESTPSSSYGI
ncbi:O-antigen ligase family protein [Pseudomonas subflava]|uniref:O-antigen ligase family protein n=1 Tax=Pseudomonas subflava TaxID=2952933 RepID=UPI002079DC5D